MSVCPIRRTTPVRIIRQTPLVDFLRLGTERAEAGPGRTAIACSLSRHGAGFDVSPSVTTALFLIVQESLTKLVRHANSARVEIRLTQENGKILLEIKDDGRGISTVDIESPRSFGLVGMRERAEGLGGQIEYRCEPGPGTFVGVEIPGRDIRIV